MEPETVDIKDFAEFLIRYCNINAIPITNLKLQKLLYYIQAWHLVYQDKHPLFNDQPEAWVNGPVYREIYYKYKPYSYLGIVLGFDQSNKESYKDSIKKMNLTVEQQKLIQSILDHYVNKSAEELVIRTHKEGPWNDARKGFGPLDYTSNPITHDIMYDFYKSKIKVV